MSIFSLLSSRLPISLSHSLILLVALSLSFSLLVALSLPLSQSFSPPSLSHTHTSFLCSLILSVFFSYLLFAFSFDTRLEYFIPFSFLSPCLFFFHLTRLQTSPAHEHTRVHIRKHIQRSHQATYIAFNKIAICACSKRESYHHSVLEKNSC